MGIRARMLGSAEDDTLALPSALDRGAAAGLRDRLLRLRGRDLLLDASGVERLHAPCLQVLLSAAETWARDGRRLGLTSCSNAFLDQAEAFGVEITDLTSQGC